MLRFTTRTRTLRISGACGRARRQATVSAWRAKRPFRKSAGSKACRSLPTARRSFDRWRELVLKYKVSGVQVHGARLVAAMLAGGIQNLLTLNGADFARYRELITVVDPGSLPPRPRDEIRRTFCPAPGIAPAACRHRYRRAHQDLLFSNSSPPISAIRIPGPPARGLPTAFSAGASRAVLRRLATSSRLVIIFIMRFTAAREPGDSFICERLTNGTDLQNLDKRTRTVMLDEIELDIAAGTLYLSDNLNDEGRSVYPGLLKDAARDGNDVSLAGTILSRLNPFEKPRRLPSGLFSKPPVMRFNAHEMLAEGEFNRFYIRALCVRAKEDGVSEVIVYRAKAVENPRPESQQKIGASVSADALLRDLRSRPGIDTALGLPPGPNSGLSVHLPSLK